MQLRALVEDWQPGREALRGRKLGKLLAAVFASLPAMDRDLRARGVAPDWWLSLRLPLSFGMATLHAASAAILLVSAP